MKLILFYSNQAGNHKHENSAMNIKVGLVPLKNKVLKKQPFNINEN